MYLESNTTIDKFEVGITKFIVARHPLHLHIAPNKLLPMKINVYFYFQ